MMNRAATVFLLVMILGCSTPELPPLDPEKSESEFRSRTLSDPGLRAFVESNLGKKLDPFPPASWDLRLLTLIAFYYHPDLDVARAHLGAARAARRTAEAWVNPTGALDLEKVVNPTPGVPPWVYGLSLSVPLDTLWKRGYRIDQAEKLSDQARLELALTGWKVRSRVRAALLEALLSIAELELRRNEETVRVQIAQAMRQRLAQGATFRLDVTRAESELATSRAAIRAAEGQVAESRLALASALGVPIQAIEGKTILWSDLETPPSSENLLPPDLEKASLANRPDLGAIHAEYEASLAALKLELAKRYPDVSIAPGGLNDQGEHKVTLGLTFTLPILDQNQGPIAEAEAHRREVAVRFRALQADVIGQMEGGLIRYRLALGELEETQKTVLSLDAQEKATRRAIELGAEDRVALTGIHLSEVVGRESRLSALKKAQMALGLLEDAFQRPLPMNGPIPEASPEDPRTSGTKEGTP
jgi:cobalt-zinc-cadmium efflux system outer membrane protein